MELALSEMHMDVLGCVALGLALAASVFLWGRGVRRSRRSDLIAGPAVLVAACLVVLGVRRDSGAFDVVGAIVMAFGAAVLVLSTLARPTSTLKKRDMLAIGAGAIVCGLCLSAIA